MIQAEFPTLRQQLGLSFTNRKRRLFWACASRQVQSGSGVDIEFAENEDAHIWSIVQDASAGLWGLVRVPPPPSERFDLLQGLCHRLRCASLRADGLAASGVHVTPTEAYTTLLPLREWALELLAGAQERQEDKPVFTSGSGRRRMLLGLAGPGGAGKTTLAQLLALALNDGTPEEVPRCVVLGMDAYHHRTAHLESHTVRDPESGEQVPLKSIKGRPPSFDTAAFVADLRRLREGREEPLALPEYDRGLHEPVDGRVVVGPEVEVVLVEGLFLLHEEGPWAEVGPLLDGSVMVAMTQEACRQRLLARQTAAGRDPEAVAAQYHRVDVPNHQLILAGTKRADVVLWLPPEGGLITEQVTAAGSDLHPYQSSSPDSLSGFRWLLHSPCAPAPVPQLR